MNAARPVAVITGGASGIGRAVAERIHQRGGCVYATERSLDPAVVSVREGYHRLALDVDDDGAVERGITEVLKREGRVDVLVNNAGFALAGPVECTSVAEAKRQFETNLFGVHRCCRQVLPIMRAQGAGLIINVSSIGGLIAVPFQAFYSASKFALEGLSEALRIEVRPFGIDVVLVEPGDLATGLTARRRLANAQGDAYAQNFGRALEKSRREELAGPSPDGVARLVARLVHKRKRKARYRIGRLSQRAAVVLRAILPSAWFEALMANHYGVR